jgi:hypothetical protein
MVKYPFIQSSRKFFDTIQLDETLASRDVLRQTESRLMSSLGRENYEPHLSEVVEFSSFFAAALVASQDGFLAGRFSKKEGDRARNFFVTERPSDKVSVVHQCFGLDIAHAGSVEERYAYSVRFEEYLAVASKYEVTKFQKWRLARQPLWMGRVYFTENLLNDFFGDLVQKLIAEGVKNLRRASFPKQLTEIKSRVLRFVPVPKTRPTRSYVYIDELMKHPVSDGRHRLVWLVLAPFLVNVKKLDEEEAIEKIKTYVSTTGEMRAMKRFVEYNVRRAKRNGLMPPTLNKLKAEHPDLYILLPKEAAGFEPVDNKPA